MPHTFIANYEKQKTESIFCNNSCMMEKYLTLCAELHHISVFIKSIFKRLFNFLMFFFRVVLASQQNWAEGIEVSHLPPTYLVNF